MRGEANQSRGVVSPDMQQVGCHLKLKRKLPFLNELRLDFLHKRTNGKSSRADLAAT